MEKKSNSEALIRNYLLGDVSDEERQQVEQQMMIDDDYFEQLSIVEEELVDEYARGELLAEEQRKFEYYFLSNPQGIEQVKLAKGLRHYALKAPPLESAPSRAGGPDPAARRHGPLDYLRARISISGYALAAAIILVLLAGLWGIVTLGRLQNQIAQLNEQLPVASAREQELQRQLAEQQARATTLEEALKSEQDQKAQMERELIALKGTQNNGLARNALATILLAPGQIRGGAGSHTLTLGPSVERVLFQLIFDGQDDESFRVALKKDVSQSLWTSGPLKAQALGQRKVVQVTLPANLLSEGDFFLELQVASGGGNYEAVRNYYFKVAKK